MKNKMFHKLRRIGENVVIHQACRLGCLLLLLLLLLLVLVSAQIDFISISLLVFCTLLRFFLGCEHLSVDVSEMRPRK